MGKGSGFGSLVVSDKILNTSLLVGRSRNRNQHNLRLAYPTAVESGPKGEESPLSPEESFDNGGIFHL